MREKIFGLGINFLKSLDDPRMLLKYSAAARIGSILLNDVPNVVQALRRKPRSSLKSEYLRRFVGALGGVAAAVLYLNRDIFTQTPSNQGAAAF